jgi:DNA helicase II / ATP-dependent DNA helicase PcrA
LSNPWNAGVRGTQILPLINQDASIIRVEAGPGTGKTFGLVRRVQRIVHPKGLAVNGQEVLIVAFNRVIAKKLQADIDECLDGYPQESQPVIRTVHALCLTVIGSEMRLLLPHEREAMIYDVLCHNPDLKTKYETLRDTEQALRDHEAKHVDHTSLWQAVCQWLRRHKAQLISDLPGLLLDKLDGGDLAEHTYKHIIVDEFQDLTAGEQQLFLRLRDPECQFVALGDSRQSIYLFRGNEREGLAKLNEMVDDEITDVYMTECQRCPPPVVAAANQLMSRYAARPMVPGNAVTANIHVVTWKSPNAEIAGMATAIVENYQANPRSEDTRNTHLVMVTRRQFGYRLRDKINAIAPSINIDLSFSESLLETWPVREAFLFFCLMVDPDAPTWRAWLGYKNSTTGRDFKANRRNAPAYLKVLDEHNDEITEATITELAAQPKDQPRGEGGTRIWDRATRFLSTKERIHWDGQSDLALIEEVFDADLWITNDTEDPDTARHDMELVLDKTREMQADLLTADDQGSVAARLRKIARNLRYLIATRESFIPGEATDIQVSTLWGAKGVTAQHVYVLGLCNETLPGNRRKEYPGTDAEYIEEQRRLFYVSLTRSKQTLVLSRPLHIQKSDARRLGITLRSDATRYVATLEMCSFMRDILKHLPRAQAGECWAGCVSPSD